MLGNRNEPKGGKMIKSPRVNEMHMHSTPTPINSMRRIKEAIVVEGTGDMF